MTFYLENADKIAAHNGEVMTSAGDSMLVLQGVTVGSATDWDGVDASTNCSIQVFGTIMSVGGNALVLSGASNEINVGSTGALIGNLNAGAALFATVGNVDVTNHGQIAGDSGIYCGAGDNNIYNSGYIGASAGGPETAAIYIADSSHNSISNSGTIEATGENAIFIGSGSASTEIDNSGIIRAASMAINVISVGSVTITNTGHIYGNVQLPDGGGSYIGGSGLINGTVLGSATTDVMVLGAGADFIVGYGGADYLEGGSGHDHFGYTDFTDSTGVAHDEIFDFDFKRDNFILSNEPADVDDTISVGKLRGDHFDHDLGKVVNGQHLGINHAVLYTPDAGSLRGETYLVIDANGAAGYQANADYVIQLHHPDAIGSFSLSNFGF